MKYSLMALVLSVSSSAFAGFLCHPRLVDQNVSPNKALEICRQEGLQQDREHLLSYLNERNRVCMIYGQNNVNSEGYRTCFSEMLHASNAILSCLSDPKRQTEIAEYTRTDSDLVVSENGAVAVPQDVQEVFFRLAQAAEKAFPNPRIQLRWEILGYKDTVPNAQAGADGRVIASSALWSGNKVFSLDEIAGILAHEIAHVMEMHNLDVACKSLEWIEADLPLSDAMEAFKYDLTPGSERAESRNKVSRRNEFAADMKATGILKAAGMNPLFMAQALQKLDSLTEKGGLSSGTHPDMQARIDRVSNAK